LLKSGHALFAPNCIGKAALGGADASMLLTLMFIVPARRTASAGRQIGWGWGGRKYAMRVAFHLVAEIPAYPGGLIPR